MLVEILDHLPPETIAMLQALYSRSPKSIKARLAQLVSPEQVATFMSKFYVGYNHKSIGDCGTTTLFIEGVSMLDAKAIQDNALYSGQEVSTRFVNFEGIEFDDPISDLSRFHVDCMAFYHRALPVMVEHFRELYPAKDGESPDDYERAIRARAFDVMRGFIPAGAHTSLSWHTNLRQAGDALNWLLAHPNRGTRLVANRMANALKEKYPSSFNSPREGADFVWRDGLMESGYLLRPPSFVHSPVSLHISGPTSAYSLNVVKAINQRPWRGELPRWMAPGAFVHTKLLLDFGSFRDLQRHRAGVIRMPLLTTALNFHPWYLEQLAPSLQSEANELLLDVERGIREYLSGAGDYADDVLVQNYIPMGYVIYTEVVQSLAAWLYRVELRSGQTIHPTLRSAIHQEIHQFHALTNEKMRIDADMSPDEFSIRRGKQTILEKT
jgi:thymidylate synthase ThyX